jgi:hypothetical protein
MTMADVERRRTKEWERIARRAASQAAAARREAEIALAVAAEPTTSTRRAAQLRAYAVFTDDVVLLFDSIAIEAIAGIRAEVRARVAASETAPQAEDAERNVKPA